MTSLQIIFFFQFYDTFRPPLLNFDSEMAFYVRTTEKQIFKSSSALSYINAWGEIWRSYTKKWAWRGDGARLKLVYYVRYTGHRHQYTHQHICAIEMGKGGEREGESERRIKIEREWNKRESCGSEINKKERETTTNTTLPACTQKLPGKDRKYALLRQQRRRCRFVDFW